jgi:hypothetical protein
VVDVRLERASELWGWGEARSESAGCRSSGEERAPNFVRCQARVGADGKQNRTALRSVPIVGFMESQDQPSCYLPAKARFGMVFKWSRYLVAFGGPGPLSTSRESQQVHSHSLWGALSLCETRHEGRAAASDLRMRLAVEVLVTDGVRQRLAKRYTATASWGVRPLHTTWLSNSTMVLRMVPPQYAPRSECTMLCPPRPHPQPRSSSLSAQKHTAE